MALITLEDARRMSDQGTRGPVVVRQGEVLTPGARDYLQEHRIQVVYPQGRDTGDGRQAAPQKYRTLFGATLNEKPEHMTHLRENILVFKDHPRIAFRGWIDLLEAEILLTQRTAAQGGWPVLVEELEQVLAFVRRYIRFDVLGEKLEGLTLCGMDAGQLREYSHYPEKHFGQGHFLPSHTDDPALLAVNHLRCVVRQTELAAYAAFRDADGNVTRDDLILGLNRLSSLMWIMMIKLKAESMNTVQCDTLQVLAREIVNRLTVEVEASGRHVHLSRAHLDALFGPGYQLNRVRDLSQPGQFVCAERVTLVGPGGKIENVVVLGPERKESQVEISLTDGRALGITPPVRISGDIAGTPGITLRRGDREIHLNQGVVAAKRHIHMTPADAARWGVADKQQVRLKCLSARPVTFEQVEVRVSPQFATAAHIDYDEANACGFAKGDRGMIVK